MKKKLISIIVAVVLSTAAFFTLTGCHFVTRDDTQQARQVVAVVLPGTDNERNIYRFELIQFVNQQFSQSQVPPTQQDIESILYHMIDQALIEIEIQRMFAEGEIVWRGGSMYRYVNYADPNSPRVRENGGPFSGPLYSLTHPLNNEEQPEDGWEAWVDFFDENELRRGIFDAIDQELRSIENQIYIERDREVAAPSEPPVEEEPEFPIRTPDVTEEHTPENSLYIPELARRPGILGGADQISLQVQAMRRFTTTIMRNVENSIRVHDEEKLQQDRDRINAYFAVANIEDLYLAMPELYAIEFLIGEDMRNQLKQGRVQEAKSEGVVVSDADVVARFNAARESQIHSFTHNADAYSAAVSGNQRILWRPTDRYFYVKHVLLPFSDAQTDRLTSFRQRPNITQAQINEFRDVTLVNEMRIHPRNAAGFPDRSQTFTAHQVFDMIRSETNTHSASLRDADRRFTDFIYMFNTDPGAFTHDLGYAIPRDPNIPSGMVPEFEAGAHRLLNEYQPGQVLTDWAVTDFGIHIMFFAQDTVANTLYSINDFETPAQHRTFREAFYEEIRQEREQVAFGRWVNNVLQAQRSQHHDNLSRTYNRRFRDLYE